MYHVRINSEAAGLEVTVRLDMRLPFIGAAARWGCPPSVPSIETSYAYHIFATRYTRYTGVGRGARPAAGKVSEEDRFSKLHCGRCMKELFDSKHKHKALNKGATYRICMDCYFEQRGSGEQDSKVWECPSAAEGKSDCLCSCAPKQAAQGGKRRKSTVSSRKLQKSLNMWALSEVGATHAALRAPCACLCAPAAAALPLWLNKFIKKNFRL